MALSRVREAAGISALDASFMIGNVQLSSCCSIAFAEVLCTGFSVSLISYFADHSTSTLNFLLLCSQN